MIAKSWLLNGLLGEIAREASVQLRVFAVYPLGVPGIGYLFVRRQRTAAELPMRVWNIVHGKITRGRGSGRRANRSRCSERPVETRIPACNLQLPTTSGRLCRAEPEAAWIVASVIPRFWRK